MTTINVCANGAVADNGVTDNTAAFNATIAQVAAAGGGNVFVPDAGSNRYDFGGAGHLVLQPGVNLVGESTKNSYVRAQGATKGTPRGSILGIRDQTNKFLSVSPSGNAIRGLTFFYPGQNETASPYPYPATIGQAGISGGVNDIAIEECVFLNSYVGIEMKSLEMGGLWIKGIKGNFLYRAIDIDFQDDWVYISDVYDHPNLWSVAPGILAFQRANAISLQIGSAAVLVDKYVCDYKQTAYNLIVSQYGACSGHFKNIANDDCVNGIRVQGTANAGITIDGWTCACTAGGNGLAYVGGGVPRVILDKALIWGSYSWAILAIGGYFQLNNSILQPSATAGSLAIDNGYAKVTGNRFESTGVSGSVSVGAGMGYWHWADNEVHGPVSIPANT